MTKKELKEWFSNRPGWLNRGTATTLKHLDKKGYDVKGLSKQDILDIRKSVYAHLRMGRTLETDPIPETIPRVMVYDIETSLIDARLWWTGKQFVGHKSLASETRIISIAYKWLGDNDIKFIYWKNKSDRGLIKKFLKQYNKADVIIGFNNINFDNRFIHARAAKYGFKYNKFVKNIDLMKEMKREFRLPSYSLAYSSKYFGITEKISKDVTIELWEDIQYGSKAEAKAAMKMMKKYNIQDVLTTEELFYRIKDSVKYPIHIGSFTESGSCPACGSTSFDYVRRTTTPAGSVQHILECDCGHQYKLSNSKYLKLILDEKEV